MPPVIPAKIDKLILLAPCTIHFELDNLHQPAVPGRPFSVQLRDALLGTINADRDSVSARVTTQ